VQDNETLDQIAQRYQVPRALLARINGVPAPYDLYPGETLKVVRGPFRAEANLTRRELTLYLDAYYAGRFAVRVGEDADVNEGILEVVEKLQQRAYTDSASGQQISAESPENPYGRHWIGLGPLSGVDASDSLGIHGTGEACGTDESRGCLGLQPLDAEDLYSILSIGSTVRIVR
jgi:LysM repeat protein